MNDIKPIKWLMQKSKKENWKMVVLIICNVLFAGLTIGFAFAVKGIIDNAVKLNEYKLIACSITIGVIVVLQLIFRLITNGLTEHVKSRLEVIYKSYIFSKIMQKKYDKITEYHSGELMNRLTNDVSVVCDGITSIVPSTVSSIARLLFAVVALVYIDWIFAIAFTVAGMCVFTVIILMRSKLKGLHRKAQESEGKTRSFMQESIENLLAIKVFSANDKIEEISDGLQQENFKIKMRRKNYAVLGHAVYNFIFSAGYVFALIYGAVKLFNLDPTFTYGALSAILQLVNNVQVPFASISNIIPKYFAMLSSAERLMEIEKVSDEKVVNCIDRERVYDSLRAIVFDSVKFSYDREVVIKQANLRVNKGDFVVISGISGIGKSTLLKLLLGVYTTESGKIYFDCNDSSIDADNSTRCLFSYVPQGNMLFSGTLKENVTFVEPNATEEQIERALRISCADEFIKTLPEGLNTRVGERGSGLSEGQVQRIAIARAILSNAPVILLDEATSALDFQTENKLLSNLKEIEGITLIIISHKKAAFSICNRHLEIQDGVLTEIN